MFTYCSDRRGGPAGSPAPSSSMLPHDGVRSRSRHREVSRPAATSRSRRTGSAPRPLRAADLAQPPRCSTSPPGQTDGWTDLAGEARTTYETLPTPGSAQEPMSGPGPGPRPSSGPAPESEPSSEPSRVELAQVHHTLCDIANRLREVVDAVPEEGVDGLSAQDLDPCLGELKRVEGSVAAIKARVVALASRTSAHTDSGMASPDHYLRDRLGISSREARKQRDLARTLEEMEGARDALADGRLGTEQASSIGRAARNGLLGGFKDVEDQLLERATTSSPEQLNEAIRREEQRANADALRRGENRAHARRRASCTKQEDGSWLLHALLDPVAGERVAVAIRAFTTPDPAGTPIDRRRRPEQRTADGLAALAEAALSAGAPRSGGHRPQVTVIVPFDAWRARATEESGTPFAELGSGTTISPEAAQRLICDAKITRVVMDARSQVLDVGRAKRTWTAGQRAAAAARDRGCRGPGCDRPIAWCEMHHVRWWSNGGRTDLSQGLNLCTRHHRLVHERGWGLRFDPSTAKATFIDPTGREHVTLPRGSPG
jgi:hypothetical protein